MKKHLEHCIGSDCPLKTTCKLYNNPRQDSQWTIAPPGKWKGDVFIGCEKFVESFPDKIINDLKKVPA